MSKNLTFSMTEDERKTIFTALEAYASELRHISDQVSSRYLAQGFAQDAEKVGDLATKVGRLVQIDNMIDQVKSYLLRQEKIQAIKYVREQLCIGLREAKEYVDKVQADYHII